MQKFRVEYETGFDFQHRKIWDLSHQQTIKETITGKDIFEIFDYLRMRYRKTPNTTLLPIKIERIT